MARLNQIAGHGATHLAEADETDSRHFSLLTSALSTLRCCDRREIELVPGHGPAQCMGYIVKGRGRGYLRAPRRTLGPAKRPYRSEVIRSNGSSAWQHDPHPRAISRQRPSPVHLFCELRQPKEIRGIALSQGGYAVSLRRVEVEYFR